MRVDEKKLIANSLFPSQVDMHEMFLIHLLWLYARGSPKGNTKLNRQNDFSSTQIKLLYFLTRKSIKSISLIQSMFLQKKRHYMVEIAWRWLSRDPCIIFLMNSFPQTNLEQNSKFFSFKVKLWYHMFSNIKKEEYMKSPLSCFFE